MSNSETVLITMQRTNSEFPWGFRLHGGREFNTDLTIGKVTEHSIADRAGLMEGDTLLKIGGSSAQPFAHSAAEQAIKSCGNTLVFELQRPSGTTYWKSGIPTIPLDLPPISDLIRNSKIQTSSDNGPYKLADQVEAEPNAQQQR